LTVLLVALCATHAVIARSHHRAPKSTPPAVTTKAETKIPVEPTAIPRTSRWIARSRASAKGADRANGCDFGLFKGSKDPPSVGILVIRPSEIGSQRLPIRLAPAGLHELSYRQERLLAPRIDHSEVRL
jgi:hypothetical protein